MKLEDAKEGVLVGILDKKDAEYHGPGVITGVQKISNGSLVYIRVKHTNTVTYDNIKKYRKL